MKKDTAFWGYFINALVYFGAAFCFILSRLTDETVFRLLAGILLLSGGVLTLINAAVNITKKRRSK